MKRIPTDLDEGTIRRIDWQELFPAVLLPQAFSLAVSFRVLWLSILGVLLTLFLGELLNGISEQLALNQTGNPSRNRMFDETDTFSLRTMPGPDRVRERDPIPVDRITEMTKVNIAKDGSFRAESLRFPTTAESVDAVLYPWRLLTDSVARMFPPDRSLFGVFPALLWFVGTLGIWTLIGGMITRTAAVRVTIGQHERMEKLNTFMNWRWRSYFAAVFLPLLGMVFCAIALVIVGKLSSIMVLDYLVAITFPLALFAGFCFAILGIGLLFGWPLAFAAISVDGSDGFDAVSRSYSYLFQRPLQCIVYVLLAMAIGSLGWYFVAWFVDVTLAAVGTFSGIVAGDFPTVVSGDPVRVLPGPDVENVARASSQTSLPRSIVSFWCWCFQTAKVGYLFGYFWTATTVIYVILRRSVDGTPFDEVRFHPNPPNVKTPAPIVRDEKGAPETRKSE